MIHLIPQLYMLIIVSSNHAVLLVTMVTKLEEVLFIQIVDRFFLYPRLSLFIALQTHTVEQSMHKRNANLLFSLPAHSEIAAHLLVGAL